MDGEMIIFWWPPLALASPYFIHLSTGVNMEDTCTQGSHALARLLFFILNYNISFCRWNQYNSLYLGVPSVYYHPLYTNTFNLQHYQRHLKYFYYSAQKRTIHKLILRFTDGHLKSYNWSFSIWSYKTKASQRQQSLLVQGATPSPT